MKKKLKERANRMWGVVTFQGVLAMLFGLVALAWPNATLTIFVTLLGIFILASGITGLIFGLMGIKRCRVWWLEFLLSLLITGFGIFLLTDAAISVSLFIALVGLAVCARGITDIAIALFSRDKAVQASRTIYIITGLISLVAGIFVLVQPTISSMVLIWVIGLYAIFKGIFAIALALNVRSLMK
jgi:uncharacterized membrane protein HdeD (DUF308 family)